jgi:hypothetical protein
MDIIWRLRALVSSSARTEWAMCNTSHLTKSLFEGLPKIKNGQKVFLVVSGNPAEGEMQIESVLYVDETDTPREALEDFCKAQGLEVGSRICIPVILPHGLQQEDVKGFKAVRQGSGLHVEFTP